MQSTIQLLTPQQVPELLQLIAVFEEVFERQAYLWPAQTHLQHLLNSNHFFAVVSKNETKVIAGLTGYVLQQYYSARPLAYIYDLGVLPTYQRKGIAKKMITLTNHYCRQQGFEEVFVQAEKGDADVLDFYRATRPTAEEEVVHFTYSLTKNLK